MIQYLQILLNVHRDEDRGASAVEYGLLVALIAVVMAVGAALFGTELNNLFTDVSGDI
ncbi:Flp family type IVb pilin [Nocardioides stalactiti]|uniref:Flp family type IVb pilin n=1 Tax=Nocardioides stalactiti TaxID=2755356 RepID=UPI001600DD89|nr:Flp family type IVb pilin [Nocardioides stalactiti]